jgi:DNA-binding protein H-NS
MATLPRVESLTDNQLATLLSQIQSEQTKRTSETKDAQAFVAGHPGRLAAIAAALNLAVQAPQPHANDQPVKSAHGNGHKAKTAPKPKPVKAKAAVVQRIPVRYRNPAKPTETWSGRGKPARWITEAIASGKARSVEDFRVT